MRQKFLLLIFVVLAVFIAHGCGKKSLDGLSPKKVVELYYQAKDDGDAELLRQIIIFPQDATEEQIVSRIKSEITVSAEKTLTRAVGAKVTVEYEKIIDDNTAEVGVVIFMGIPGLKKRVPFQQVILKKEDVAWKFYMSANELTEEQLVSRIRENPYDASAIYLLGRKYQPENPVRANRYYRKYCQLEPEGFWVSKQLLEYIERSGNIEEQEKELLAELQYMPEQAPARASVYWTLGQLFTEHGEYKKAKVCFDKAEKILKLPSNQHSVYAESFDKAKKAFELEVADGVTDILMELEAEGAYEEMEL